MGRLQQAQFALLSMRAEDSPQRQLLRPITAAPPGGFGAPVGVAVNPNGSKVYVANNGDDTVSAISTATDTVTTSIPVGVEPTGLAVNPDGNKVYVANSVSNNVWVIATATDTVIGSPIPVGKIPVAYGIFIQSPLRFAGTPGRRTATARAYRRSPGSTAGSTMPRRPWVTRAWGHCKMPSW